MARLAYLSARRRRGVVLAIAAWAAAGAAPASARVVEKIAAVVGDEIVLASEVEERATPLLAELGRITDRDRRAARAGALRREVLDRLIDEKLVLQQAAEFKLTVTSEDIDRSIDEIKRQNNIDDEGLKQALAGQHMSMSQYRQDLKRTLLRYKVINAAVAAKVGVSDEEVRAYYDRHMKSGGDVQVKASHIFLAIPDGADAAAVADKQKAAQAILVRAQAGEDFAKLAKETSEDAATRNEGGDLGTFGKDTLPKPIEELVFAMKPGEIRGPVRADRGFHVIKLIERSVKDAKPFAEVKDEIRGQVRQREMDKQTKSFIAELRKRTLVDVRL